MEVQQIKIEDFDYPLPDERIAKYPLEPRDSSHLLLYRNGAISQTHFNQLADHLPQEAFLIFNNTKVIQARLRFSKPTGAEIEIFCLEPSVPHDYSLIFLTNSRCRWWCMVGNLKRWKEEPLVRIIELNGRQIAVKAERVGGEGQTQEVEFSWNNPSVSFAELLEKMGELPIPPYLNRKTEKRDEESYQTIYSKIKGSVAAPTAGLHFTPEAFSSLRSKGIGWGELTLHVGAGTFRPVKSETMAGHEMHAETFTVPLLLLKKLLEKRRSIVAVGTTSVRTLESLYWIGVEIMHEQPTEPRSFFVKQWTPYQTESHTVLPTAEESLQAMINYLEETHQSELNGATQIIIAPGYRFRLIKAIITNFHQPRSTLLLLISTYLKGDWHRVYDYALENDFRFLSYGDSSLLWVD